MKTFLVICSAGVVDGDRTIIQLIVQGHENQIRDKINRHFSLSLYNLKRINSIIEIKDDVYQIVKL